MEASPRYKLARLLLAACLVAATPAVVSAQGFQWPWEEDDDGPPPQREPTYRPPPTQVPPAQGPAGPQQGAPAPQGGGAWATKNPICLQLEQRLVQEGQRGNASRSVLPQLETEMRTLDQSVRQTGDQLERGCYEFFLFSKSLRNNARCRDLARQNDADRRRLAELSAQRQDILGSGGRSYQDDIISELARNNCGASYQQQARRRESSGPFGFWEDDSEGSASGGGGLGTYGNLGYATYRTLCVRLCDGYYFPVSFSTLPNHFQRDAETCQSKCAAPVELYYYQNPGAAVEQAVGVGSNTPYTELKTAFRYRKEYVQGCSCKQAEFVPQSQPQQSGAVAPAPGSAPASTADASPAARPAPAAAPEPERSPEQSTARRAEGEGWSTDIEQQ